MLANLIQFGNDQGRQYPQVRFSILECVEMAEKAIEEGASEAHECELATQSIKDIIKEAIEDFEDFED